MLPTGPRRLRRSQLIAGLLTLSLAVAAFAATSWLATDRTSAQPVASPTEVVWQGSPPTATITLHADGPVLNWEFDVETQTPAGWQLGGFWVTRWIPGPAARNQYTLLATVSSTDQRYQDSMSGVSEAHRVSGAQFQYAVWPFFNRVSDGREQAAVPVILTLTVPALPAVTRFGVEHVSGLRDSPHWWPQRLWWSKAHLPWGANRGFATASQYILYRRDQEYARVSGSAHNYSFEAYQDPYHPGDKCAGYKIRARYGLFYSDYVWAEEHRRYC